MFEKKRFVVQSVNLPHLDRDTIVDQRRYLTYQRGEDNTLESQMPIRDYRLASKKALRKEEKILSKNKLNFDLVGREILKPAILEIIEEVVLESGLSLPIIELLSQPDFTPPQDAPIFVEIDLEPGDEIMVNESLWYWLSSNNSKEPRTMFAITSDSNPLIVKHSNPDKLPEDQDNETDIWYTVLFSDVHYPMSDELDEHFSQNTLWLKYQNYFQ